MELTPRKPRPYMRRSAAMLGEVKGAVAASIALGLAVSALPFVANAAFGPVMQAVANAGMQGDLARVWGLEGSLLSRARRRRGGPLGWLATPLPFVVLLLHLGGRVAVGAAAGPRQVLDRRACRLADADGHPPARPRSHSDAVAGLLHRLPRRRLDAAGAAGGGGCSAPADRVLDPAAGRRRGAGRGAGVPDRTVMADDRRGAGAFAACFHRAPNHRKRRSERRRSG